MPKRAIVIGGTGFLGCHAVREFLIRGWQATALGLPPAPPPDLLPASVDLALQDLERMSDEDLLSLLHGHEALVFAAGLDDRVTPKKPSYPTFHHANVEVCLHILRRARQAGIERAVVLGSYFAHFDRIWTELHLSKRHPYIRSRIEQEQAVTSIPGLDVCVLELPYIFGDPLGRRPLWYPLIRYLRFAPVIFYPKGGSACVSVETVRQAIVGAIERGQAGACYPIGDENLTWPELLIRLAAADGRRVRVMTLPTWLVKVGLYGLWTLHQIQGKEAGLDPRYFAPLQTAETFLDPQPSKLALGYQTGGLDEAFRQTVAACRP